MARGLQCGHLASSWPFVEEGFLEAWQGRVLQCCSAAPSCIWLAKSRITAVSVRMCIISYKVIGLTSAGVLSVGSAIISQSNIDMKFGN